MPNFFLENPDILFHFKHLDLKEIVALAEDGYMQAKQFPHAPVNYEDAMENYWKVLEVVGGL
ncbi:MAG TPA: acyl-CoA dehydrogenase, partial [Bacteroidota bacterium]|nr:acyl-CoA dehydrogenase [Bacteroidota bacterium]